MGSLAARVAVRLGVVGVALAGMTLVSPAAHSQVRAADTVASRLRPADRLAAALIRRGGARSPSLRAMFDRIEQSDLVVYVETRVLDLPGKLQLGSASADCRHIRISIRTPGLETEQIAWLAHELWHAVELAGALDVRDQQSLVAFYERIGARRSDGTVESAEAQEMWRRVLREVRVRRR